MLQLADAEIEMNGESGKGYKAAKYVEVNNPAQNLSDLWIFEHDSQGYHIRNVADSYYPLQTEWNAPKKRRTHDQIYACQWTKVNITKTDNGWQIENGQYTGNYFGYWSKENNQNEVASDKQGDEIGKYTIYAIERAKCLTNYVDGKDLSTGVDVTSFLINPTVKGQKDKGSVDVDPKGKVLGYTISNINCASPYYNADKCEFWGETASAISFEMSQTVYVPNGKYTLSTSMYNSSNDQAGDSPNGNIGVFANENFVGITTDGTDLTPYTVDVTVTDGVLKIGYKTNGAPGARWFVGSGFKLTYYGEDLTAYTEALKTAITTANAITPSASDAANKALKDAIAAAKEKTSETTSAALIEANNALKAAVEKYNAYVSLKEALAKYPKKEAFTTSFMYYEDANSKYESAEISTEEVKIIVDGMRDGYRQYLRDIVKEYKTATAFVVDATRTEGTVTGWTPAAGVVNYINVLNSAYKASDDFTGNYMENWTNKALSGNIYQKVNVPNGKYFLKMSTMTTASNEENLSKDYIYISSGDVQSSGAVLKNDNPSITITDPIEVKNGEVEIGLHIGSGCQWALWNAVELYAYSVDDQTRSTATGKYGTVCLPYNATVTGAKLYEAAVNDAKNEVVLTEATGNIEAGKAYIYQATADEQTFAFVDDANMVKDPATASLTGVFAQQTAPAGAYVLQTKDGEQKFFKVAEGSEPTINAYRAYLNVETASAAKALTISFGNPTAVDAVKALTEGEDAVIYDLSGKRLSKLQRGVNIVNGVKVIVK